MKTRLLLLCLILLAAVAFPCCAAVTLTVWCSGGLMTVLQAVAPVWQQRSGVTLVISAAPSMGNTPQSIPQRLRRHQHPDVLVMVDDAIRPLVKQGWIRANSQTALADSFIAAAVPQGQPVPDISTEDKLRRVLLSARRVAYSDSASGRYVSRTLFRRLGIAQAMRAKSQMIPATPVGLIIARGQADIGFQQWSELQGIKGVTVVGLLPASLQKVTRYSAVVLADSPQPQQAKALIAFLASQTVAQVIAAKGMRPVAGLPSQAAADASDGK